MKKTWILILLLLFSISCKPKNEQIKNNNEEDITTYNVTYHYYNGETETISYKEHEIITLEKMDERTDYEFLGWSIDQIDVINNLEIINDIDLYSVFKKIDYIATAYNKLDIPSSTTSNLILPNKIDDVEISWESELPEYISNEGIINRGEKNQTVTLHAIMKYQKTEKTYYFDVTVLKEDDITILNNVLSSYVFDDTIVKQKISLKQNFSTKYNVIGGTWKSSEPNIINDKGELVNYPLAKTSVKLTLTLTLRNDKVTKDFYVIINPLDFNEKVRIALENVNIDKIITNNKINLPTLFEYDIVGKWKSNNPLDISDAGIVLTSSSFKKVKMTLSLSLDEDVMDKEYEFIINNKNNLIISDPIDYNVTNMENCHLEDGLLVLDDDALSGSYESDIISTISFSSLVPTWDAVTNTKATVRFFVKAYVDDKWSDYIYYSSVPWGLGLNNASKNQTNTLAKLDVDEFIILNNKLGTKVQFKLELKRDTLNIESPKVFRVALALESTEASFNGYSLNELPQDIKYDVPKLYQQVVPSIGSIICSATSTTMLLKYKGLSFVNYDSQYEHRYVASLVKDCGNNIYGNWVYNCVTMGAYGFKAYVKRMESLEELCNHLAYVGPVALSVRGTMASDKKTYTTNGHLIVITGYNYNNGVLSFYSNDPNVQEVSCVYSSNVIDNVWYGIAYVIE